jgi:hypothetical protein
LDGKQELLVYDNGGLVWRCEDEILAQGKLGGPVQHAVWSHEDQAWRIAGWREEVFLSAKGFERSIMEEIPVHIMVKNGTTILLLNNGEWLLSAY